MPAKPEFPGSDFQFHPIYREKTSFDAAVGRIQPGPNDFLSERQHQRLAPFMEAWQQDLLSSPGHLTRVAAALDSDFRGASWHPISRQHLRDTPFVERVRFSEQAALSGAEFVDQWQASLDLFEKLLTVDLQMTQVEASSEGLTVKVRYELVGTGRDFYREQRSGYWNLEWKGERVVRWRLEEETRARTNEPYFADVTRSAFGGNLSYEAQLCHGADYWRTVLDGASGVDIYGHNGVSVGDVDGDGFDDLYVCQAAGLPNRLFRNRGDGTFEDVTDASGVGLLDNTACALFADF